MYFSEKLVLCLITCCCLSSCSKQIKKVVGYVEGEYTLIAPLEIAQTNAVNVRRRQHVVAGYTLAIMQSENAVAFISITLLRFRKTLD